MAMLLGASALEISRVVVAGLIPLVLVLLGWFVNRATKRLEQTQWANQKLIERRMELHKELSPDLNSIYCFFDFVGHFRDVDPDEVIRLKRVVDGVYHTNDALFSPRFREAYGSFMKTCFKEGARAGDDASLRSAPSTQKFERGENVAWDSAWDKRFTDPSPRSEVRSAYVRLKAEFARDLQLHNPGPRASASRWPGFRSSFRLGRTRT